jgi:hypothetical protein
MIRTRALHEELAAEVPVECGPAAHIGGSEVERDVDLPLPQEGLEALER